MKKRTENHFKNKEGIKSSFPSATLFFCWCWLLLLINIIKTMQWYTFSRKNEQSFSHADIKLP